MQILIYRREHRLKPPAPLNSRQGYRLPIAEIEGAVAKLNCAIPQNSVSCDWSGCTRPLLLLHKPVWRQFSLYSATNSCIRRL